MLCFLCSCTKGESNLDVTISPLDKSLIDLATNTYSDSQLSSIVQFGGSISEINKQYPIECVRKINGAYRVSYLGDCSVAVLIFDESGNKIIGNVYSTLLLKSDFEGLNKGELLKNVQELDPNGEYLFLYTGRNDVPRMSSHYTIDGYLISIEYDSTNTVVNIVEELL